MSHDGLFVIRERGIEQYYYSRWGGLTVDRDLLTGPDRMINYIRSLEQTDTPATYPWMTGAIFVNVDTQSVWYWANQFFGSVPAFQRYYRALLQQRWPGWQLHWAKRAIRDFAEQLPAPSSRSSTRRSKQRQRAGSRIVWFEELAEGNARAQLTPYDTLLELEEEQWRRFQEQHEPAQWAALLAEHGEEIVRSWAEYDHDTWVTVRWSDGRLADYMLSFWFERSLCAGPTLLRYLRSRPSISDITDHIREDRIKQTIFVDEAQQHIDWWWGIPDWLGAPLWADKLWPGWTLTQHDGGSIEHMALTGRSPNPIRCPIPEAYQQVREILERMIANNPDLLRIFQQELSRRQQELQPDHKIIVAPGALTNSRPTLAELPEAFWQQLEEIIRQNV